MGHVPVRTQSHYSSPAVACMDSVMARGAVFFFFFLWKYPLSPSRPCLGLELLDYLGTCGSLLLFYTTQ